MSRIGRQPIPVPSGVTVSIEPESVRVNGPKGELMERIHRDIEVTQDGEQLLVTRPTDRGEHRALHGLTRTLVANMVVGVTDGWSKELEIIGVGYRAANGGPGVLDLALGFSHPVKFTAPEGITFEVPAPTRVIVKGATPLADSRNARRFDKLRRDGAEGDERAKAPREGGGFKSARPSRAEGGARFERRDSRPPRERKFEGGEGPARGPRPPRAEVGKPPRARGFTPREGAASREARAPRAEGAGRFERTDARASRAAAPRERAEYKGARAPRENAPRERNFERGEGPARGPRPPAEGGAKAPRARAFAPREGTDFKGARPARGKEQAGGPRPPRGESARPSRDASARPPRGDGDKKFDGPRKPSGSGGKPRGPGGSGKPPRSSGPRGPRGPR